MRFKHGLSRTREYSSWLAMTTRCNTPSHVAFNRYGGRGITVCARWASFENFYADMGSRPAGMSLDRIENGKGYEPGNCKWSTPREQIANSRLVKHITIDGVTRSIRDWALTVGVHEQTIHSRIRRGMSPEDAITKHKK